jgi:hypothetical protein
MPARLIKHRADVGPLIDGNIEVGLPGSAPVGPGPALCYGLRKTPPTGPRFTVPAFGRKPSSYAHMTTRSCR